MPTHLPPHPFTQDLYFETFKELLAPLGHKVDAPFYAKHVHGKVDRDVFSTLLPPGEREDEARLSEMSILKDQTFCAKAREHGVPIIPGLADALAMAKREGIRCLAGKRCLGRTG